jgi:hypothetical protein
MALQRGLNLPRPASIPMRCDRSNSTCIEELRKPPRKRQATHPSATALPSRTNQYQQSCTNIRLSSAKAPYMQASCKTQTGEYVDSEFRMSDCVSYGLIGLRCNWKPINPADFENGCSDCKIIGTRLDCLCGLIRNTVDLGELSIAR